MFFHTGREFEIYAIGDGLYMQRILNGVAAMSNSGTLTGLVALGLIVGLLVMAVRNVMAGGWKLEIGTLMTSFLLAVFLFGMRADVLVHDMSYVPGQKVQGDFTVANMPFGIAAIGSFVSTIGVTLTERMEQGYSIPGMEDMAMSRGGFGKVLEWVNSIRLWEVPPTSVPGGSRDMALFKSNLDAYIRDCTIPGVEMGHICLDAVRAAPDPLTPHTMQCTGGIGYMTNYRTVEFVTGYGPSGTSGGGKQTVVQTCADGFAHLAANAGNGASGFYDVLGSVFPESVGAASAQQVFANAIQSIGVASGDVQGIVMANAVGASLDEGLRTFQNRLSMTAMSELMVEQASQQRLVQWAAEETMFRRIMRPMMAFFESIMYALAPFMALAVGLGTFGFSTIMRYIALSLWVSLWMPVLSIIQLFQITAVQHVVRALYDPMTGSMAMTPTSIAGAHTLRSEALEWMATGAALAAWTPIITMALVYGGSYTASALAGKMQGQDTINEKMAAPDVVSAPPSIQRGSMGEFSEAGGGKFGGAQTPTLSWSNQSSLTQASERMAQQQVTTAISNSLRSIGSESFSADQKREWAQDNASIGLASDSRSGTAVRSGGTDSAAGQRAGAGFDATRGVAVKSFDQWWAGFQGSLGISAAGTGAGGNAGRRVGGESSSSQAVNHRSGGENTAGLSESDNAGWSQAREQRNALSTMAQIREAAANGSSWAQKIVNQVDSSEEVRAAQSKLESHRQAASNVQSSSLGHTESIENFVTRVGNQTPGGLGTVTQSLKQAGQAMNAQEAYHHARGQLAALGLNGDRLEAGAWTMALTGYAGGTVGSSEAVGMASAKDRAAAFGDAIDGAYSGQISSSFSANTFEDIAGGVGSYGDTVSSMERPQAPGINVGALQGILAGGAPAAGGATPDQVVGNEVGGQNNLDPGAARGAAVFSSAKELGDQLRDGVREDGYRGLADQHQTAVDGSVGAFAYPGYVNAPVGTISSDRMFNATSELPHAGQQEFDTERAQLQSLLPDAPDSVTNALAVSNLQARGIPLGEDVVNPVNSGVSRMNYETSGILNGYVDQSSGGHRVARDAARNMAGEEYTPDIVYRHHSGKADSDGAEE